MALTRVIWEVAEMEAQEAEELLRTDHPCQASNPELRQQWLQFQATSLRTYADLMRRLLCISAASS